MTASSVTSGLGVVDGAPGLACVPKSGVRKEQGTPQVDELVAWIPPYVTRTSTIPPKNELLKLGSRGPEELGPIVEPRDVKTVAVCTGISAPF